MKLARALVDFFVAAAAFSLAPALANDGENSDLAAIVEQFDLAGASLAIAEGDEIIFSGAAGCAAFSPGKAISPSGACARPLRPDSKMRMASITKMAVAFAAQSLADEGAVDLDADVSCYLGATFRNPHFPDRAITLRQLFSHTSSLRDPTEYWAPAPGLFENILAKDGLFADPLADGGAQKFAYANVNTVIAAAALERAANERIDRLVEARVFAPLGLDAGLNWSGVDREARSRGATLYRKESGAWTAQTDSQEALDEDAILFPGRENVSADYLDSYKPGANPSLFSPQGGMRASVENLISLLAPLRDGAAGEAVIWRRGPSQRERAPADAAFDAHGFGVQIIEDYPPAKGVLIGHAGFAYGLYAGAWAAPEDNLRIAFAVNGTAREPEAGAHVAFNEVEEALMHLAFAMAARR